MKLFKLLGFSLLMMGLMSLAGCKKANLIVFDTATIKHSSIDWSAGGIVPVDWNDSDGETIAWCSIGTPVPGVTGLWYRSNTVGEEMYNLGNVALESVSSYDPLKVDSDVCESAIRVGDVWLAKCKDGYVKFKVTSFDENDADWPVVVEYEFSTTTNFQK